ncbi:hypothetical protein PQH04_05645 [Bacteroides ovatus]|nr:hypothetical protein [Bacteroides ovatus]MDC7143671.1 hypothetical protein [Bacteroides ovatus]
MRNDIVQYPKIQTGRHLPKRLSGSADNCIFNDPVTYRFNDFMTYCRQSAIIRNIVSPMNRIRDEPPVYRFIEAETGITGSVWKQQIILSTT